MRTTCDCAAVVGSGLSIDLKLVVRRTCAPAEAVVDPQGDHIDEIFPSREPGWMKHACRSLNKKHASRRNFSPSGGGVRNVPTCASSSNVRHVSAPAAQPKRSGAPPARSARWETSLGPPAAVVPFARASARQRSNSACQSIGRAVRPTRASGAAASLQNGRFTSHPV